MSRPCTSGGLLSYVGLGHLALRSIGWTNCGHLADSGSRTQHILRAFYAAAGLESGWHAAFDIIPLLNFSHGGEAPPICHGCRITAYGTSTPTRVTALAPPPLFVPDVITMFVVKLP